MDTSLPTPRLRRAYHRILKLLRENPAGMSRTEIRMALKQTYNTCDLEMVYGQLIADRLVTEEIQPTGRRPRTTYREVTTP